MATAKSKTKSSASKGTGKATKSAKGSSKKKLGTDAPPVKGRA